MRELVDKGQIITHPGSSHLDDFLSSCLVVHESKDIEKINRRNPTKEEILDVNTWVLDIGNVHDPDLKCFDHHQEPTSDCALSLLLKHWGIWEKAIEVFGWLKAAVIMDALGPHEVKKRFNISGRAFGLLDSFVERSILELFEESSTIAKSDLLFKLMEKIGKKFFTDIEVYFETLKIIEKNAEFVEIGDVTVLKCYNNVKHSPMLLPLLNKKRKEIAQGEKNMIIVYPNNRPIGTIAMKRYGSRRKIDFTRISSYENVIFAHKQGFFVSVNPMSDYELEVYINDSIR